MKKKILSGISLILVLVISVGALSSCIGFDLSGEEYLTREDFDELLNDRMLGEVTVEAGDNYNVTIEGGGGEDLSTAAVTLLSSVSVECLFTSGSGYSATVSGSSGSGVIYQLDKTSGDAIIITNYHVVYSSSAGISKDITVNLYGQEHSDYDIAATYVGGSMYYDIAVLRVEDSEILARSNAIAAKVADSDEVAVLDTAIAIGNAAGEGISATAGHVNVDSEDIIISFNVGSYAKQVQLRVMRIDTAVNSGNSGGGLFNERGELIGIVNAKMTDSADDNIDNIGYAIPSNVAKYVVDNILYYCLDTDKSAVYRCILGITVTAAEMYTEYDLESGRVYKCERVAVATVNKGAAAEGKLKKDDVINSITIDGTTYEVTRIHNVVDVMLNARVGSSVSMNITRGTETLDVTLDITEDLLTEY
ncbi:MAG: trypsin-like peptidase domain-containing protein [Clostridia bacterium]|nr:trypsin-like peptidase domain-containing protein [Clostridia bacterium]